MEYKKSLHLAFGIQDELRVPLTLFRGLELQPAAVFIHKRGRMDPLWAGKEGPVFLRDTVFLQHGISVLDS